MASTVENPLNRALLNAVIEHLQVAVLIVEAAGGRVLAVNAEVERIWRRPARDSPSVADYAQWEGFRRNGRPYLPHEWPIARSILHGEVVDREEIAIRRGDGTAGMIRVSSAPIRGERGEVIAGVVTFIDVTDERREQDALVLLAEASALAGESLEAETTLDNITRLALPKFADLAFVHLVDPTGGVQRHRGAAADPDKQRIIDEIFRRFPPPPIESLVRSGTSVLRTGNTDQDAAYATDPEHRALLASLGVSSALSVPMRISGKTYGVLTFALTRRGQAYDSFDVLVAEEIGRRAAAALERSHFFDAEREQRIRAERAARRVEHLQTLTTSLAQALTIDGVCDAVMLEVANVINARGIVLMLRTGDDSLELVRHEGIAEELARRFARIPVTADVPIARAVASGEAVWLRDRSEANDFAGFLAAGIAVGRAWAAIPLVLHGRALGAIGFAYSAEQDFAPDDKRFLESIAAQCAIALERARLFESERRAREEAERASRAKDEFLAILSHELRTPMTTVIGWADFLMMTREDDAELAGPLEALRHSARVQAKLVDDLLDVSRIVTGKLSIDHVHTELTAIVRRATDAIGMTAREKGLELVTNLPPEPVPIEGDPDRLLQIVSNLVVNAVKFTPSGGRVEVSVAPRGDDEVDVVVEDDGEGISPEFLPHVFERFRQASVGDSRRHAGLGLGLSIVQHLVELHGGRVSAHSEGLGQGARFVVTLPTRGANER